MLVHKSDYISISA